MWVLIFVNYKDCLNTVIVTARASTSVGNCIVSCSEVDGNFVYFLLSIPSRLRREFRGNS